MVLWLVFIYSIRIYLSFSLAGIECLQRFSEQPVYTEVNPRQDALLTCKVIDKRGSCSWQKDNKVIAAAFPIDAHTHTLPLSVCQLLPAAYKYLEETFVHGGKSHSRCEARPAVQLSVVLAARQHNAHAHAHSYLYMCQYCLQKVI